MRRGIGTLLGAMLLLIPCASIAQGYTAKIEPWENCGAARAAEETAIEANASPATGTSVAAGSVPVFSTVASVPVTFTLSLSSSLTSPFESAVATPMSPPSDTVSITSAAAAATPGDVYWTISFSTASLSECAGITAETIVSKTRTLTVLAPPAPPAPVLTPNPTRTCKVPRLIGLSLQRARSSLLRADCTLGWVHSRTAHRAGMVVRSQSLGHGLQRPAGTPVSVTLGRASHRA